MAYADVVAAAGRIGAYVLRTPVLEVAPGLVLKLELLQHSGSFKVRGAFNRMLAADGIPAAGVIAASGGNHGLAVAYAARALGARAEIFVPEVTSPVKLAGLRALGARINQVGAVYAEAAEAAVKRAAETGALPVHAYDQAEVVAGQGTTGLELMAQTGGVDTILVAVGGGGFAAGVALGAGSVASPSGSGVEAAGRSGSLSGSGAEAAGRSGSLSDSGAEAAGRSGSPAGSGAVSECGGGGPRIVAVEPERIPTFHEARKAGRPVAVEVGGVAADSLGATALGELAHGILAAAGADSVLVTEEAIVAARRALWDRHRLVAEHGGATAYAALLSGAYTPAPGERVAVLVCGSNTDPATLAPE
ncbi:pyridoxal-phosphate dependent enzyme [Nonomuraea sp. MCN248]|uniref:Pyridoxal-phosphate dependent enzyme n=1 Tax=Nonomuraea corallina TaxID=2989783 RepID=A0ABT4SE98_9ACTN|nr:pyridoxal-phosphate dependent enzyme [Nonomuraea corallina]MDA0635494.1 pyridoxal-phosphate dependent enzyme [Nonomuraea corallina]